MSDTISFCWIGIHSWSKWKDILGASCGMFQLRECESCGKKDYKDTKLERHDWSQWEDKDTISVYRAGADTEKDFPIRRELVQTRLCKGCGVKSSRRILV